MGFNHLEEYKLLEERRIEDVKSQGYVFLHKKSGARVVVLSNNDDNKVFCIGFRTTPQEDTGVPHILEHSVLCGSKNFPVKTPFMELSKSSLNTFLNAMTYPDKTIYPVASYNDKDFKNLMHVYMDAVFYPKILEQDKIFKQEGWHYELEGADEPLTINGVVYNEMKGAYSSPDEILMNTVNKTLFPDNTYGRDSGGTPDIIPTLTYEHYLEFYKKYYHPSNAYIYLYGDMDVEERLKWMDREYLSDFDYKKVDSEILYQTSFEKMKDVEEFFPITDEEPCEDNTILSYNKVIDSILDTQLYYSFDVLEYALAGAPGSPVRQALTDAGIGQDIYSSLEGERNQFMFSFVAKNANASQKTRFVEIIEQTLSKLVKEGIDKKSLLAGINISEFRFREADYGQFPKGLLYGMMCLESWLYDDSKPFVHLECLDTFEFLKAQVETDYFEQIIEKYLLQNQHGAVVSIVPKRGLGVEQEKRLEDKLADYKASLSEKEIENIIDQTKYLKEFQDEPDKPEDLATIPYISRSDIRKDAFPFSNIEKKIGNLSAVVHDYETNGIEYVHLLFDANDLSEEELPYFGLLRTVIGYVNTKNYSFNELSNEINILTGGISGSINIYPVLDVKDKLDIRFDMGLRTLSENLKPAMELVEEMLLFSDLADTKRLLEIVAQIKSRLQVNLSGNGHSTASTRAMAGQSSLAYCLDMTRGIGFYQEICKIERKLKETPKDVTEQLERLVKRIFTQERLIICYTNTEAAFEKATEILKDSLEKLPASGEHMNPSRFLLKTKKEGFTDASLIQYVCRAGNFVNHGYEYTGAYKVLRMILEYEYLWNNIRVKGGAYGCMDYFLRTGDSAFASYRDPNLGKTIETFEKIPDFIKEFTADEETMTKYIVGTFGVLDSPLSPEAKGTRSMAAFMEHLAYDDIQKERKEILETTDDDIRKLAMAVASVLQDQALCVIGNETAIKNEADCFETISGLLE